MEITKTRLKELERLEQKMNALEAAGLDNWEGYGIAMEEIEAQEEIEGIIIEASDKALDILESSLHEPSERGAGFSTTEEARDEVCDLFILTLKELLSKQQ